MNTAKEYSVAVLFLGLALCLAAVIASAYPPKPLNLIVISLDSVSADHLGLYGYSRDTMPTFTAWAKDDAAIFTNYFATSYLTPISEVSVQTGDYPFSAGVVNFAAVARPTVPFLAEVLKGHGYETATFGSSPEYVINPALKDSFSRGFDVYKPFGTTDATVRGQTKVNARTSSKFMNDAFTWMNNAHVAAKPFYLWLPLGTAHMPYLAGKPVHFADPSYSGPLKTVNYDEFPSFYGFFYNGKRYDTDLLREPPQVSELNAEDLQYLNDRYDDGLYFADQILSRLFTYLKSSGLDSNTIVVFESEHGETLGERGYIAHYDIHDETVHVPLVIKIPGMKGRTVSALMSGVDIFPTVLSALNLATPPSDGMNYLPLMKGTTLSAMRDSVLLLRSPLWERVSSTFPDTVLALDDTEHFHDTAIRSAKWKLIHRLSRKEQFAYGWWGVLTGHPVEPPEYELYDLTDDPGETKDVYQTYRNDPSVIALMQKLTEYDTSIEAHMPGPTQRPVQPYF